MAKKIAAIGGGVTTWEPLKDGSEDADAAGARLVLIADAGHMIYLEATERVASELAGFAASLAERG